MRIRQRAPPMESAALHFTLSSSFPPDTVLRDHGSSVPGGRDSPGPDTAGRSSRKARMRPPTDGALQQRKKETFAHPATWCTTFTCAVRLRRLRAIAEARR